MVERTCICRADMDIVFMLGGNSGGDNESVHYLCSWKGRGTVPVASSIIIISRFFTRELTTLYIFRKRT